MNDTIPPKGWESFLTLCSMLSSKEEFDRVFDLFLTIEEKNLLASRALIIKELLEERLPQREIAKIHHVSIAQITRGSNALKRMDSLTKKFLKTSLLNWWR
ncbi:MAG: trp operon repressor [Chlamydiota bacterium]